MSDRERARRRDEEIGRVGEWAKERMGDFGVLSLFFVQRGGLDCQIYLTEDISFFEV